MITQHLLVAPYSLLNEIHAGLFRSVITWVPLPCNLSAHVSITLIGWRAAQEEVLTLIHPPFFFPLRASLMAQTIKSLPAVQETWVQSLGWEGPLEKRGSSFPYQLNSNSQH